MTNPCYRWSNLRAKVVLAKQRIAPKMQLRSEQISNVSVTVQSSYWRQTVGDNIQYLLSKKGCLVFL